MLHLKISQSAAPRGPGEGGGEGGGRITSSAASPGLSVIRCNATDTRPGVCCAPAAANPRRLLASTAYTMHSNANDYKSSPLQDRWMGAVLLSVLYLDNEADLVAQVSCSI